MRSLQKYAFFTSIFSFIIIFVIPITFIYINSFLADTNYQSKPFNKGEEIVTKCETELVNIIEENLDPSYKIMHAVKMKNRTADGYTIRDEVFLRLEEAIKEIAGYWDGTSKIGSFTIEEIVVDKIDLGSAYCMANGYCEQHENQRPEIKATIKIRYKLFNSGSELLEPGAKDKIFSYTVVAKATHIKLK